MGNRLRPDYLTAEFPKWMENNGFRRLRFHDLRHSCAILLLANGVPLKQIQDWLGHSSFKITADAYAHLEYESKIAAANAMTWVKETSLAQNGLTANGAAAIQYSSGLDGALLDDINGALVAGLSVDAVMAVLKRMDAAADQSSHEQFSMLIQSVEKTMHSTNNMQPALV